MRALIASGTGRYADPWHPFPRTSGLLADILATSGFDARIESDADAAMRRLDDVDLLVVNAGDPWRGEAAAQAPPAASIDGFAAALDRGIGIVAVHSAVSSLRDYPRWAAAIGAVWIPGGSFHPPLGETVVMGVTDGLAVTGFTVEDERYCRLQGAGDRTVVAWFDGPDGPEPAAWIREVGASRVAVDVLGHDERSYAAPGHRALIAQLASWAASGR